MPGITFHVPADWIGGPGLLPFYRRLDQGLTDLGVPHRLVPMDRAALPEQIAADEDFHILNHARAPHPRVLSAGVAYIYPFWHLDPLGIRAFSSIRDQVFDPTEIPQAEAEAMFQRLHRRQVVPKKSRYEQSDEAEDLPDNAVAVFFQSEGHRNVDETCYLDRWTMLETCLAADPTRPVIVKPHPREMEMTLFDRLVALSERHKNLTISLSNIHDILARADQVVTINSAVGVEAYLHEKPVILCGQADFHHIATSAQTADDLHVALTTPAPPVDHKRYLAWYFGRCCLDASAADLTSRLIARIRAQGYHFT